jgi:hypothetical protein
MATPRLNKPHTPITGAISVARPVLTAMRPGDVARIELPDGPFSRSETARRLGTMARTLWGVGHASVKTSPISTYAIVTRKESIHGSN